MKNVVRKSHRLVLVVGERGTAPASVVEYLIDAPDVSVAAVTSEWTWIVARPGPDSQVRAFIPGQRAAISIDRAFAGPIGGLPRRPRRIEIENPAVPSSIHIAGAPEVSEDDHVVVDLLLDAARKVHGMVFITALAPFNKFHYTLFSQIMSHVDWFAFVLGQEHDTFSQRNSQSTSQLVHDKREVLATRCPPLASAPWYTLSQLDILRKALTDWGRSWPAVSSIPQQRSSHRRAEAVTGDECWRVVLHKEANTRKATVVKQIANDLLAIYGYCERELSIGMSYIRFPGILDRQLHAFSVRITHRVEADSTAIIDAVSEALLGATPDQSTRLRFRDSVCRIIGSRDETVFSHALMLTTTAAIAKVHGHDSLNNLDSLGVECQDIAIFPPVGVAVNASCYSLWKRWSTKGPSHYQPWLLKALMAVEIAVGEDINLRYGELMAALDAIATDSIDHGFLIL